MSIDEFIKATKDRLMRVDVLHLSPPCQYFSPAHTHQSVHDEANIYALFACSELINKLRPRLITLEQTFGITHERHYQYLKALIGDYTQLGYSHKIENDLLSLRPPREKTCPPFPKDTHSVNGAGGLEPFTTIGKAIGSIHVGDDLHNLDSVKYYRPRRAPLDPNRLAGTITTGGSEMYYPDGSRDFTLREYACIQGFPKHHKFIGSKTCIRRQIGNAFPPNTVRVLYQHLEDWLLQQDGMTRYQSIPDNVFIVDDSDDDDSDEYLRWQTSSGAPSSPEIDEDIMEIACPRERRRGILHRGSPFIDLT
ncbi:hypothetical protein TrVGV298_001952 [Trichoderma virens]|nr:hypothetical protein TrVGV298_001952 [Trichoderma virens]